jgi:hypothetical protein
MFGSIDIKTRPLKFALLVDANRPRQVRDAIRLASTLWGGAYSPIIPLHERMPRTWRDRLLKAPPAKRVTLGYIEAFDPDALIQFSAGVPDYVSELGLETIKPEQIWNTLKDGDLAPQFGIGIFEILHDVFEKHFKYKVRYPVEVALPRIPSRYALFWASVFGEIPEKHLEVINRDYGEALEITSVDVREDNLSELFATKIRFPRRLVDHGIKRMHSHRHRSGSVFFLDATKVEDVIDFWNLRALGDVVIPVPKQLKTNTQLKEIVVDFLKRHRRHWRHNRAHCDFATFIRARNCTEQEMTAYATSLAIEKESNDPSNDPFFSLQPWYPRVWDEWARDKDGAVPAEITGDGSDSVEIGDTEKLQIRLRAILPSVAKDDYAFHGEARCANEINFRFYGQREYLAEVFPKSTGQHFLSVISGLGSFGDWRVGRNGLVKLVKYEFSDTRSIPTAEQVFFAWLTDLGWQPKLSSPGLIAKQIYHQTGGFPAILANEKLLGLLEYMNGGSVRQDGTPGRGNVVNQDRDLEVGEVKRRLHEERNEARLHDLLVSMGAFKLGLRVACPKCLRRSWFPMDRIRDAFDCPRCLNEFPAIGNLGNATWCYKTAGPFSIARYGDGAYGVLLTLRLFDDRGASSIQTTPVMSFVAKAAGKKELEADFAMFWQESIFGERLSGLLFGECKTYGKFGRADFQRMRYLAKAFPGAVLVFSTLRKSLSKQEVREIARIAKAGRRYWKAERPINPVLVLTATELFHFSGPPYSWDKTTRERFKHSRGLLGLCDATQQLYLDLPSWHTEWREKWDRRRARRAAKEVAQAAAPANVEEVTETPPALVPEE